MLALTIFDKEVPMSEQGLLFAPPRPTWIAMIWQRCDAEVRRECITILAEMGRASLRSRCTPATTAATTSGAKNGATGEEGNNER
jgi:hypothetical protein